MACKPTGEMANSNSNLNPNSSHFPQNPNPFLIISWPQNSGLLRFCLLLLALLWGRRTTRTSHLLAGASYHQTSIPRGSTVNLIFAGGEYKHKQLQGSLVYEPLGRSRRASAVAHSGRSDEASEWGGPRLGLGGSGERCG